MTPPDPSPSPEHEIVHALRERAVVARATGVLMATRRCPAEEALDLLTASAAASRRTLPDVAAAMLAAVVADRG